MKRENAEIIVGILLLFVMVSISYYLHEIDRKLGPVSTITNTLQNVDTLDRKLDIIIGGNAAILEETKKPVKIKSE